MGQASTLYTNNTTEERHPSIPSPRVGHNMVYLPETDTFPAHIVIVGGVDKERSVSKPDVENSMYLLTSLDGAWVSAGLVIEEDRKGLAEAVFVRVGMSAVAHGENTIYYFGGWSSHENHSNDMFKLERYVNQENEVKWLLSTIEYWGGNAPSPRDKLGMVEYAGKLVLFGGWGPIPLGGSDITEFVCDMGNRPLGQGVSLGWNFQLFEFNLTTKIWRKVQCQGQIPTARAAFSMTRFPGTEVAAVFGGRDSQVRRGDLHILDMEKYVWTRVAHGPPGGVVKPLVGCAPPVGRSWHVGVGLDAHTIIIHGGFTQDETALGDLHVLHRTTRHRENAFHWGRVNDKLEDSGTRLWHAGVLCTHSREITFFGGCKKGFKKPCVGGMEDPGYSNEVFSFKLEAPTLKELCCETICKRARLRQAVKCGKLLPKVVRLDLLRCSEILQISDIRFVPQSPRRVRLKKLWMEPPPGTKGLSAEDAMHHNYEALSQLQCGGGASRETLPPPHRTPSTPTHHHPRHQPGRDAPDTVTDPVPAWPLHTGGSEGGRPRSARAHQMRERGRGPALQPPNQTPSELAPPNQQPPSSSLLLSDHSLAAMASTPPPLAQSSFRAAATQSPDAIGGDASCLIM